VDRGLLRLLDRANDFKAKFFLLRYEVRLNKIDEDFIELGICFRQQWKVCSSEDDMTTNYGFEHLISNKNFTIDKKKQ